MLIKYNVDIAIGNETLNVKIHLRLNVDPSNAPFIGMTFDNKSKVGEIFQYICKDQWF